MSASSVRAVMRNAQISPQKVRLSADMIRGLPAEKAVNTLRFSVQKGASLLLKTLESAIANAENNLGLDIDELYVSRVFVDESRNSYRFSARARGRSDRITKRSSHITVHVASVEDEEKH